MSSVGQGEQDASIPCRGGAGRPAAPAPGTPSLLPASPRGWGRGSQPSPGEARCSSTGCWRCRRARCWRSSPRGLGQPGWRWPRWKTVFSCRVPIETVGSSSSRARGPRQRRQGQARAGGRAPCPALREEEIGQPAAVPSRGCSLLLGEMQQHHPIPLQCVCVCACGCVCPRARRWPPATPRCSQAWHGRDGANIAQMGSAGLNPSPRPA